MRKIGVLVIHGMGSQQPDFAEGLIARLRRELDDADVSRSQVEFEPVWWARVLIDRQEELMRRMQQGGELDGIRLRRFIVEALGDAVAYQKTFQSPSRSELPVYDAVHDVIGTHVHALAQRMSAATDPLVVIGHSLGCHMISNYIWDVQKAVAQGLDYPFVKDKTSAFELFRTLTAIDTFGCNIPLFLLASDTLSPINFPIDLTAVFPGKDPSAVARWRNYYDPDDVLGWPLQPVPGYEKKVQDKPVNAGGILNSWNPLSHTAYWTDGDVVQPIAKNLIQIALLL